MNPTVALTIGYVAGEDGSVRNFMSLWDDFLVWKTKATAEDIQVNLWPHTRIDDLDQSKLESEFQYEHYHFNEPTEEKHLPLKWFELSTKNHSNSSKQTYDKARGGALYREACCDVPPHGIV